MSLWALLVSICSLAAFSLCSAAEAAESDVVQVGVGQVSYKMTSGSQGAPTSSGANAASGQDTSTASVGGTVAGSGQALSLDYNHFLSMNFTGAFGFREGTDKTTGRNYYMGVYGGGRFYPLSIGHPVDEAVGNGFVHFDTLFKPYLGAALTAGHAIYSFTNFGSLELGADTVGVTLTLGSTFHFFRHWVVEPSATYEIFQSHGQAKTLDLEGTNLFIMVGSGYLF